MIIQTPISDKIKYMYSETNNDNDGETILQQ